jgi:hypothetical protein
MSSVTPRANRRAWSAQGRLVTDDSCVSSRKVDSELAWVRRRFDRSDRRVDPLDDPQNSRRCFRRNSSVVGSVTFPSSVIRPGVNWM